MSHQHRAVTPTLEPLEDITRRDLIKSMLAGMVIIACGGSVDEAAKAPTTRTFEHSAGTTQIPIRPKRIVTTTDQNALLPLLELGVRPVGSAGVMQEDGSHLFRRTQSYETSGITYVGEYGEPDLELVAAQRPDLIVGYEFDTELFEPMSKIAPTVLIQVFDRPLPEALKDFADVVGAVDRWNQLKQEYDTAIAALRADLPRPPSEISVSLVQFGLDGQVYAEGKGQAVWTVITDVGFARPLSEQDLVEQSEFSFEQLREHEADLMLTGNYSAEGWDNEIQAAQSNPIFQSLDVVKRGEFHVYDGTKMVGSAFEKMQNFIGYLRSILVDRTPNFG